MAFEIYRLTPVLMSLIYGAKAVIRMNNKHAAAVILENDKVLLMKRSITDPWKPCHWALPGGGIDKGESPEQGLIREIKEETHLDVLESDLEFFKTTEQGKLHLFIVRFHKGVVDLKRASHGFEHETFGWFSKNEMKKLKLVPGLMDLLMEIM